MFSLEEQDSVTKLKISEVMVPILERHLGPMIEGAILFVCGDDKRVLEKLHRILALSRKFNGGKLFRVFLLADYNPPIEYIANEEYRIYIDGRIRKIRKDKGLKNIVLHGHGPCTHGLSLGLTLEMNMAVTTKAAVLMDREHCQEEGVVQTLYHTDPTDIADDMRTYGFDVRKWDKYNEGNATLLSSTPATPLLPPR